MVAGLLVIEWAAGGARETRRREVGGNDADGLLLSVSVISVWRYKSIKVSKSPELLRGMGDNERNPVLMNPIEDLARIGSSAMLISRAGDMGRVSR